MVCLHTAHAQVWSKVQACRMHTYILEISAQMPSTYLPAKFAQTIQTEFTLSGSLLYSYSILYEAEMVAE